MRNLTILLFSLFFLSLNSEAQELKYNKQYALNGSTLLSGFIDLPSSPYQFSVKTYGAEKNKRFQIGLNVGANLTFSNPSFSGGFGIQIRGGEERFEDFGKENKWRVFYGVDGIFALALNSFSDNFRVQLGGGFAPFAGIQYRINERLSIYTEASYQALLNISPNSGDLALSITGEFLAPASLWVAFDLYKKEKEKKSK